jgi:hypothetical protein
MSRELLEKPLQQFFGQVLAARFGSAKGTGAGADIGGWLGGLLGTGAGAAKAGSSGTARSGWLGGLFESGGFFGSEGALFGSTGFFGSQGWLAGLFAHEGAVVGAPGNVHRVAPAAFWHGAERYHGGGRAGLPAWIGPREVPAILELDEVVLNRGQQRAVREALAARSRPVVHVEQHIRAPEPSHYRASLGAQALGVHRALQRVGRHV